MRLLLTLMLGLALMPFASGASHPHRNLVALQRQSPSGVDWRYEPIHHHGVIDTGYVDRDYPTWWHVIFRYVGCPVTLSGAFGLTIFTGPSTASPNHGFVSRLPEGAVQYSRPLIDKRSRDDAIYGFLAKPATTYYYRVVIPSSRGCRLWQIDHTTN